jgi:hypothetical protein
MKFPGGNEFFVRDVFGLGSSRSLFRLKLKANAAFNNEGRAAKF